MSKEQVEAYRRDGFIVVADILSPPEIAALREVTDDPRRAAPAG